MRRARVKIKILLGLLMAAGVFSAIFAEAQTQNPNPNAKPNPRLNQPPRPNPNMPANPSPAPTPVAAPAPAPNPNPPPAPGPAANPAPQPQTQQPPSPPKNLPKEDKNSFTVNFKDVELEQIIKTFSDITGKNFILEQIPKGKITIVSPVKIPKSQAINVFEAILNLNGYNIVATSIPNLFRIVPIPEAPKSNLPIYLPEQKPPAPAETYIIRFIPLKYMDSQEAVTLVQPLLSKESASVMAYTATNTLIIVDTSLNINRIVRVLEALDVPSLTPEMEIVYLHNSAASDIAATLSQIFTEAQVSKGGKTPTSATLQQPRAGQPGAPAAPRPAESYSGGPGASALKIIPEQRLNALILIAQRDMLDQVKKIIALLDVTSGDKGVIHVYYCKNARARELAGILAGLGGGVGGGFQQSTTRTTQPSITSPYGGTSTYGGMSNYSGMSGMSGMSGASGISGFGGLTTGSRSATASGPASATLTGGLFEGEIKISADDMVNSLLIVASPRDYDTLRAVIEKLDIPRRQVFVEAVLLEVTLTQTRSMSTSLHAANALSNNGAIIGSSAPGSLNSLTLLSQLASAGTSIPGGMTLAAFGQQFTVPGTDGKLVVPSAGYILNMLASDNNVNVLSTPTILTTDNQDAEIQVGEEIPIPTGQSIATGGISSVSITRETVGIKLKITPQICESGTIRMDIAVETSNAVPSSLGVNVNTLGVTTTLKTASTTVIVKDTQTIVIGGLMQDTRSADNSRFPLIGDIPVLGWLFKSADKSKTKNNLIILITPHVVHSDEEVERMRQKFKGQYDSFVEESLNREGKSWDEYFSTKYSGTFAKQTPKTEETIDLTGPKPKIINENPPQGDAKPKTESGEFSVHEGIEQGSTVNPLESSTVLSPEKAVNPNQDQNVQPAQPAKKKHWYDRNPKANSSDTGAQPPQ